MKKGIHPEYRIAKITCACGNVIVTRSTIGDYTIDICSACHPFYKGDQTEKLIDKAGKVEKFRKRYKK